MSYLKLSILSAILIIISTSVSNTFAFQSTHNLKDASNIYTLNVLTDHDYWAFIQYDYYAGTSISKPCSDLTRVMSDDGMTIIHSYTDEMSSEMIEKTFGSEKTCIRLDITIAGIKSVFTTGDIQLLWDKNFKAYTLAHPDSITIDFNKQQS
jgi:hypothetical protein